jgi:hypothetical protein
VTGSSAAPFTATRGRLHGVQLGLLNNARNNRGLLRVLPLVNVHLH